MKNAFKVILLVIVVSCHIPAEAQEIIGVIYDTSEAEKEFGEVKNSIAVPSEQLENLLNESGSYMMFNIFNKNLYILNENRNLLYPDSVSVKPEEVFRLLSVSKVFELLEKGQNQQTFFEERENAFSITNGSYTLEQSSLCPPYCKR